MACDDGSSYHYSTRLRNGNRGSGASLFDRAIAPHRRSVVYRSIAGLASVSVQAIAYWMTSPVGVSLSRKIDVLFLATQVQRLKLKLTKGCDRQ